MRKTLFTIIALITSSFICSYGQNTVKRYETHYSMSAGYEPLVNPTDIGFFTDWNDTISDYITLPFTFRYQNAAVNNVVISSEGDLYLNGQKHLISDRGHITGINMDYKSAGRGKVSYTTTGTVGNRIFKVEYKNVSRRGDTQGNDTLNFQIWLHESDYAIEYRAGYCNVPQSAFAKKQDDLSDGKDYVYCGLICNPGDLINWTDTVNSFYHFTRYRNEQFKDTTLLLSALTQSPEAPPTNPIVVDSFLYGVYPVSGSVIRFGIPGTNPTVVSRINPDMASAYPNPSKNGIFRINLKETPKPGAEIMVYEITGKLVRHLDITNKAVTVDLSSAPDGHYIARIINGNTVGQLKLVKN